MSFRLLAAVLVGLGVLAGAARADLMITVGNGTVTSGGTGSLDVFISSDAPATLSEFSAEFLITRTSGASNVGFQETQPSPQFGIPSYIFYGVSNDELFDVPAFVIIGGTNYANDTLSGGDSSSAGPVAIPVGPDQALLARLTFTAPFGAAPGDTFEVALVLGPDTVFIGESLLQQALSFTTSPGTVVVTEAAVPEPTALLLVGLGVTALAWSRRRWRPSRCR